MPRTTHWLLPMMLILSCLCGLAAPLPARAEGPAPACPSEEKRPVDLNAAGAEELQTLPRIGPARARAILRARARLGGFRRISQLLQIKGIGRATLRQLRPFIVLGTPLPATEGAAQDDAS